MSHKKFPDKFILTVGKFFMALYLQKALQKLLRHRLLQNLPVVSNHHHIKEMALAM